MYYFTLKLFHFDTESGNKGEFCFHFMQAKLNIDIKSSLTVGDSQNTV